MPPKLRIKLLGEVTIQDGKKTIEGLPSRAAEALFLYLACTRRPVQREKLAELLWADRSSTQALTNLRTILTPVKRELGDFLVVDRDTLAFNADTDTWLDADEFESQLRGLGLPGLGDIPDDPLVAAKFQEILDLYQGDFLEGFHLRDGQGFEEWAILQRERLKQLAREGFRLLTRYHFEKGSYASGLLSASRWQRLDPYDEEACRTQMWLFIRTGQRGAALQCYQSLKEKLGRDLQIVPSSVTTDLFRQFQQIEFPPVINLPAFSTEFLGRGNELDELAHLLSASKTRLITITGPGGIGKTRLAVDAAQLLAKRKPGQFLHGIHFIPLAAIEMPDDLPIRIAENIGFNFQGLESLQKQLLDYLKEREALLVLDNFEHLFDEAGSSVAFLVETLRQAPGVSLLVTSRERLNLYDEIVFDIEGLSVPPDDKYSPQEYSAITLFSQSAKRVRRDYSLKDEEKKFVAQICRRVDGMPLAIELASAWMRQLSCEQIASQIESDTDFLTSPYQDVAEGHRSLRAVFKHSWALLSEAEQVLFSQLSVFRGGFNLEAVEAVIDYGSQTSYQQGGGVGLILSELVDKSLVQRHPDERFDIHPMLWQYASEKLSASNSDLEHVSARHTLYYLNFLTRLENGESPQQREAIRPERDNIRLAWEQAAELEMFEELEKTAGVLHSFFSAQSWFQEGIDLFQRVLDKVTEKQPGNANGLLCDLLGRKARMHTQVGQLEKARADLQQALKYLETMDDPSRRSRVLDSLAITNYYAGDYPQATALAEESLRLSEKLNNSDGMAFSLNFLGSCAKAQGEYDRCRDFFERAVKTYHVIGDEIGAAMVLNNLGNLLQLQGNFEGARGYYIQSSEIFKTQDHAHGAATTLANAGKLATKQGEYELARSLLDESLAMKRKINDQRGEAVALAGLGDIALDTNAFAESKAHFLQALRLSHQVDDVQLMIDILAGMAALAAKQGQNDMAGKLVSYVLHHDGAAEEARQRAVRLRDELGLMPDKKNMWNGELVEDVVEMILSDS